MSGMTLEVCYTVKDREYALARNEELARVGSLADYEIILDSGSEVNIVHPRFLGNIRKVVMASKV